MKKIHFEDLKKINFKWLPFIILAALLTLFGVLIPFEIENLKIYKLSVIIGILVIANYWSRQFWFKNYVQWDNRRILIRLNSFLGKSMRFNDITSTELVNKTLYINKSWGKDLQINLSGFDESDSKKLYEILINNTIANMQ